jgi:hypothetical protein
MICSNRLEQGNGSDEIVAILQAPLQIGMNVLSSMVTLTYLGNNLGSSQLGFHVTLT